MSAGGPLTPATMRAVVGLISVVIIAAIVAVAVGMFQGGFTDTVPLTVMSQRAGLVMNPDAKVQTARRPGRQGRVHRERCPTVRPPSTSRWTPSSSAQIPDNVAVDIASTTVFGAKSVGLRPARRSVAACTAAGPGARRRPRHRRVQHRSSSSSRRCCRRSSPRSSTKPSARSPRRFNGRGEQFGQTLSRPRSLPGQARAEPAEPESRPRSRARRCSTPTPTPHRTW